MYLYTFIYKCIDTYFYNFLDMCSRYLEFNFGGFFDKKI